MLRIQLNYWSNYDRNHRPSDCYQADLPLVLSDQHTQRRAVGQGRQGGHRQGLSDRQSYLCRRCAGQFLNRLNIFVIMSRNEFRTPIKLFYAIFILQFQYLYRIWRFYLICCIFNGLKWGMQYSSFLFRTRWLIWEE